MLDLIRKKQKSVIVKIVFWAIIATFVGTIFLVWGKGSDGGPEASSAAITINGSEISFEDYQVSYSNLYRLYQNIYREQFTPALEKKLNLRQQAIDTLIDQTLLMEEAKRQKIKVSKQELVDSIAQVPAFQENGVFNKERYLQVLSYQRMTPDGFEQMQKRQLLIGKVQEQLKAEVTATADEITQEYREQNEMINLEFVRLAPALFEKKVKVDEEQLQAFFSENREDFRLPETVALRYLQFDPARYEKDVTLSEKELNKHYRRHLDRYEIPEQVKASHVLIKVAKDADQDSRAKKRALAEKVLEEARSGKDFAELADTYSDDAGSAAKGGELGFFTRGTMVAPFEQAAFALKPGDISGIVESSFGFHIIKSQGYIEAGIKPLADVLEEVQSSLRVEKAGRLAQEKAMDAYNLNRKTGDLEAAAKANDLGIKETGFFGRGEPIDGISDPAKVAASAFALQAGELARPVILPEGIVLLSVKERRDSRLPELDEVRDAVEQTFQRGKREEQARQAADEILAALKEGKKLKAQAKEHGVEIEETGLFARTYGDFIPRLGNVETLAQTAFDLTMESPAADEVYEIEGKYVVAALKERQEADMEKLDLAKHEQVRATLVTRKQEEALKERLQQLRDDAEIIIAPTIVAAIEKD